MEEIRNYGKIVCIKNNFENGWWKDAYSSSYSLGSAPGHKLQKPSKESGIFQSLGTINFVLCYQKGESKRRAWSNAPHLLNTLLVLSTHNRKCANKMHCIFLYLVAYLSFYHEKAIYALYDFAQDNNFAKHSKLGSKFLTKFAGKLFKKRENGRSEHVNFQIFFGRACPLIEFSMFLNQLQICSAEKNTFENLVEIMAPCYASAIRIS